MAQGKKKRIPLKLRVRGVKGTKTLEVEVKKDHIEDVGSFSFGYCTTCEWRGPGRRSRAKARDDVEAHKADCPIKSEPKVQVAEGEVREKDLKKLS